MKKYQLALVIAAAFAVAIVLAVALPKSKKGGLPAGVKGGKGKPAAEETVFRVTTAVAVKGDLYSYIEANGDVEADNTVDVYPDISGKLARMNVHLGSKVKKGETLAYVDPSKAGANYSLSPIVAPISGTVTSLPQKVGATVTTGTVVGKIGDIENLQVTTQIAERYVAVLKNGLPAVITFEAYPGVEFHAKVFRVSPLVDSTSRTKEIFLSFDAEDSRINVGMYAGIKLYTTLSKGCVTVPEDSIVTLYDKDYVYVMNADSTVTKREITKGVTVDGVSEIRKGLSVGERVALEGVTVLSDGVKVRDIKGGEAK